jgi:RecB family exonuclease
MNESMTQERRQVIHRLLEEPGMICVFPSETIARFWIADYAKNSTRGAILLRKAISYDTFRAMFLPHHEKVPVNKVIRQIFALKLLESSASASLSWFVSSEHPEARTRFASSIAMLLPQLDALKVLQEMHPGAYGGLPSAMRADIESITHEYKDFLDKRNLFEPKFEHPSIDNHQRRETESRYCVCFPEVLDDWEDFIKDLEYPDWITTVSFPSDQIMVPLEVFENELVELRTQLRRVEHLLELGVDNTDIAITVASSDSWHPYILHEASIRDIPLQFVEGVSPLDYPAGRFLNRLREVSEHDFSLSSMKELLLDPSYPWKNLPLHRKLIARAVKLKIERGSQGSKGKDDWEHKLSLMSSDRDLFSWYRRFKQAIIVLMTADTAQTIRTLLFSFQDDHFVRERWKYKGLAPESQLEGEQVFSFCLDQLNALGRAMETGAFKSTKGLFSVYLQILQEARYVRKERESGIPVYPYGLSAGIHPLYHFVLGCNHEATEHKIGKTSVIPESLWDQDTPLLQDVSGALIACYLGSGTRVSLSFGRHTFNSTVMLPPAFFIEHDSAIDHDLIQDPLLESMDKLQAEEVAWATSSLPMTPLHVSQKNWFMQAAMTVFESQDQDYAVHKANHNVVSRVLQQNGMLKISATSLDSYVVCPFRWASHYLFSINEDEYTVESIDHRAIGILIHEILNGFFNESTQRFGIFSTERIDCYKEVMDTVLADAFKRFILSPEAPRASTIEYIRCLYQQKLPKILEAESKNFDDTRSIGFETALTNEYPDRGFSLEGRIDRILRYEMDVFPGQNLAIVDYKKTLGESRKKFDDPRVGNPSMQLPLYAKLLLDTAMDVPTQISTASYYNVAKDAYVHIWKQGEEKRLLDILTVLDEKLDEMVQKVNSGDFRAKPSRKTCASCGFRQICRRRYSIQ